MNSFHRPAEHRRVPSWLEQAPSSSLTSALPPVSRRTLSVGTYPAPYVSSPNGASQQSFDANNTVDALVEPAWLPPPSPRRATCPAPPSPAAPAALAATAPVAAAAPLVTPAAPSDPVIRDGAYADFDDAWRELLSSLSVSLASALFSLPLFSLLRSASAFLPTTGQCITLARGHPRIACAVALVALLALANVLARVSEALRITLVIARPLALVAGWLAARALRVLVLFGLGGLAAVGWYWIGDLASAYPDTPATDVSPTAPPTPAPQPEGALATILYIGKTLGRAVLVYLRLPRPVELLWRWHLLSLLRDPAAEVLETADEAEMNSNEGSDSANDDSSFNNGAGEPAGATTGGAGLRYYLAVGMYTLRALYNYSSELLLTAWRLMLSSTLNIATVQPAVAAGAAGAATLVLGVWRGGRGVFLALIVIFGALGSVPLIGGSWSIVEDIFRLYLN